MNPVYNSIHFRDAHLQKATQITVHKNDCIEVGLEYVPFIDKKNWSKQLIYCMSDVLIVFCSTVAVAYTYTLTVILYRYVYFLTWCQHYYYHVI